MRTFLVILLLPVMLALGCARFQTTDRSLDYRTVSYDGVTNTARAERLYRKSLGFIDAEGYEFAEQHLQKSLLADVNYGPSHNALGKVYFAQGKYYLAAWEFEHAADTLPSRAEPLNNLGLVYEAVDQYEKAISHYQEASSLSPESPEYLGNLLRARIRNGESVVSMRSELENLVMIEHRQDWSDWARKLLAFDHQDGSQAGCIVEGVDAFSSEISSFPVETIGQPNEPVSNTSSLPSLMFPDAKPLPLENETAP